MTVDPAVVPGLLLLALELLALAAVGYVVARVALRQSDDRMALAQGLVIGLALWGLLVNFVLHLLPGYAAALGSWVIVLVIGVGLAWRTRQVLRLPPRTLVGFAVTALVLFWVALASRQTVSIPDDDIHLGPAALVQAGGWPPVAPWTPDQPLIYHYGLDLLIGLLAPPFGPNLAFVTEILSAYVWTGFILVVATILLRNGGRVSVVVLTPLLLVQGAWTHVNIEAPAILQIPLPAGPPADGLRASLSDIYWPTVPDWTSETDASPPNIWKPHFVVAYASVAVLLERISAGQGRSWRAALTLAALLGFLGTVNEPIALMAPALWLLLNVLDLRHARGPSWAGRAAAGPALAALLLAVGGGAISDALFGSSASGLSLGWIDDPGSRKALGDLAIRPGGIGLLSLGMVPVATAAVLLARRQRMVLAFAVGSGLFILAAFTLQYALAPHTVSRFDGHARNFALLALLFALGSRLPELPLRWRYTAAALIFFLLTWPATVVPVRKIGSALVHGPQFTNAQPDSSINGWALRGRYAVNQAPSEAVVSYVRSHTAVDARILSPHPSGLSIATGRPNASGFPNYVHLHPRTGPEYADAIRYLEPAAVRRLDFSYVHATDAWVEGLPRRARRWLADSSFFQPLVRDGPHALFRIQTKFLELEVEPATDSFEALRQAAPASALVYLAATIDPLDGVRVASVLSHTQLLGHVPYADLFLFTDIPSAPLDSHTPDLVVASRHLAPSGFDPGARRPIWWNETLAVYAPNGAVEPVMPAPQQLIDVQVTDSNVDDGRLTFTATFTDHAPDQWTGQDWLVTTVDVSPWAIPAQVLPDGVTHEGTAWFAGQTAPGLGTLTRVYEFDARAGRLAVRGGDGDFATAKTSGPGLGPGAWTLAVRLRRDNQEVAFIPVMKVTVSETNDVTYQTYEGVLGAWLRG